MKDNTFAVAKPGSTSCVVSLVGAKSWIWQRVSIATRPEVKLQQEARLGQPSDFAELEGTLRAYNIARAQAFAWRPDAMKTFVEARGRGV